MIADLEEEKVIAETVTFKLLCDGKKHTLYDKYFKTRQVQTKCGCPNWNKFIEVSEEYHLTSPAHPGA